MPRRTKLTDTRQQAIVDLITAGNWIDTAATAAGIGKTTLYRWLQEGEAVDAEGQPLHPEQWAFREAVERARAASEVSIVRSISKQVHGGYPIEERVEQGEHGPIRTKKVAGPDGRLGMEMLARQHPTRWGRRQAIEVSGPEGGPIVLGGDPRALAARWEEFARRRGMLDAQGRPAIEGEVVKDA